MPVRVNDLRLYTGAASQLVPPITAADCAMFPSFEELVKAEQAAGRGATIRHGVAFAKRTVGEIATSCAAPAPLITNVQPDPTAGEGLHVVTGSNFGVAWGKQWVTNGATWAGSTIKVEQSNVAWTAVETRFTFVRGALLAADVFMYVETSLGVRNAVGYLFVLLEV